MASKLSQVLVLLAAVSGSLQRKLVSDADVDSVNDNRLQNLVAHLKTHAFTSPDAKPYLGKQRSDLSSLLNIQTLNLYVRNNEGKKGHRSEVELDRICKATGRCGCKGCNRDEDREEERKENSEVQQILDELEQELGKDQLRCAERCGGAARCGCKGRSEDKDEENQLRCGCKGRSEDKDEENQLRCGCKGRSEDKDEENQLRCGCKDRPRSEDKDEEYQLRCRYGRCGRESGKISLKSQLEKFGRKYRISDKLDAIVVDISNVKGLLGQLNGISKNEHQHEEKEFDFDYLGDVRNNEYDKEDDESLDGIVLSLDHAKKDKALVTNIVKDLLFKAKQKAEQDNDPIRPNELADFFEAKKQQVIGNALNFVRNSRGNKDLSVLSNEQQYQLQKVRSEVQRLGANSNMKQVERSVIDIVLGEGLKSEVLPHNVKNNNVYIPSWVYNALKSSRDDLRSKRLFPLTNKQKMKMSKLNGNKSNFWRRNIPKDANVYGVPFQLQVEGLGQISP